jgi:hypothetical protein
VSQSLEVFVLLSPVATRRSTGVTQPVLDYLLWHHLGPDYTERAHDLVNVYKHYFEKDVKVVRDTLHPLTSGCPKGETVIYFSPSAFSGTYGTNLFPFFSLCLVFFFFQIFFLISYLLL